MKKYLVLILGVLTFGGCLEAVDYKIGGQYECDGNSDCVAGFTCYKGKCERAEDVIKWSADGNTEPPDSDSDGVPDDVDECPLDPAKQVAGLCGCNKIDIDSDSDDDKVLDCNDACPANPLIWREDQKDPLCGCVSNNYLDSDSDGKYDCEDACPYNALITIEAQKNPLCGCEPDIDSDGDGIVDCNDACPANPLMWLEEHKDQLCGCVSNNYLDSDSDGKYDCEDACPYNALITIEAQKNPLCGCEPDIDNDGDGIVDCNDACPANPHIWFEVQKGECGCIDDVDSDNDKVPDCKDVCPLNGTIWLESQRDESPCGCAPNIDSDGDEVLDCMDNCPQFKWKVEPGICGCELPDIVGKTVDVNEPGRCIVTYNAGDVDSDMDKVADKYDACPKNPNRLSVNGSYGCLDYEPGQYPQTVAIHSMDDWDNLWTIIKNNNVKIGTSCDSFNEVDKCINDNYYKTCINDVWRVQKCSQCQNGVCQDAETLPLTEKNLHVKIMEDLNLGDYYSGTNCRGTIDYFPDLWNTLLEGKEGGVSLRYIEADTKCTLSHALFNTIKLSEIRNINININFSGDNVAAALTNELVSSTLDGVSYEGALTGTAKNYSAIGTLAGKAYGGFVDDFKNIIPAKLLNVSNKKSRLTLDAAASGVINFGGIAGNIVDGEVSTGNNINHISNFTATNKILATLNMGGIAGYSATSVFHDVQQQLDAWTGDEITNGGAVFGSAENGLSLKNVRNKVIKANFASTKHVAKVGGVGGSVALKYGTFAINGLDNNVNLSFDEDKSYGIVGGLLGFAQMIDNSQISLSDIQTAGSLATYKINNIWGDGEDHFMTAAELIAAVNSTGDTCPDCTAYHGVGNTIVYSGTTIINNLKSNMSFVSGGQGGLFGELGSCDVKGRNIVAVNENIMDWHAPGSAYYQVTASLGGSMYRSNVDLENVIFAGVNGSDGAYFANSYKNAFIGSSDCLQDTVSLNNVYQYKVYCTSTMNSDKNCYKDENNKASDSGCSAACPEFYDESNVQSVLDALQSAAPELNWHNETFTGQDFTQTVPTFDFNPALIAD